MSLNSTGQALHTKKELYINFKLEEAAWCTSDVAQLDKYILVAIAGFASQAGYCYPSISTLVEKTGFGKTSIKVAKNNLISAGHLIQEERFKDNRQTSNRYFLPKLIKEKYGFLIDDPFEDGAEERINIMISELYTNQTLGGRETTGGGSPKDGGGVARRPGGGRETTTENNTIKNNNKNINKKNIVDHEEISVENSVGKNADDIFNNNKFVKKLQKELKKEKSENDEMRQYVELHPKLETAKRVMIYLNKTCNKKHGTKGGLEGPTAILKALDRNYTEEELNAIIDLKASLWLSDARFSIYLTPETLFRKEKLRANKNAAIQFKLNGGNLNATVNGNTIKNDTPLDRITREIYARDASRKQNDFTHVNNGAPRFITHN